MRKIMFRGKCDDKWHFGDLLHAFYDNELVIEERDIRGCIIRNRIVPATVGQFTGRTDKNGQKGFEGDILSLFGGKDRGVVLWSDHDQCYFISPSGDEHFTLGDFGDFGKPEYYEVIGNIHDNPELLKGGGRPMTAPTTEGGGAE